MQANCAFILDVCFLKSSYSIRKDDKITKAFVEHHVWEIVCLCKTSNWLIMWTFMVHRKAHRKACSILQIQTLYLCTLMCAAILEPYSFLVCLIVSIVLYNMSFICLCVCFFYFVPFLYILSLVKDSCSYMSHVQITLALRIDINYDDVHRYST